MLFFLKITYNLLGGYMSKDSFKEFVKRNNNLINIVEKGETSWQKLYELYDLYGENSSIWDKYLNNKTINNNINNITNLSNNFKEIINFVKGIDLNSIQKGLNGLDKAIDAFKDILPDKSKAPDNIYEPKPNFKYYED